MHVRGSGATEGGLGGGDGAFFAVGAVGEVVVGLAGDFADGVGSEGAVFRSGAGGKGFGVEFGEGVVADFDAGFMLGRGLGMKGKVWRGEEWSGTYALGGQWLTRVNVSAKLSCLIRD